jgi:transposase
MFYGSDNGGRTAAVLTSFITTCKRHGIDPFAYLRDLFERISTHPENRLAELLPDKWMVARR